MSERSWFTFEEFFYDGFEFGFLVDISSVAQLTFSGYWIIVNQGGKGGQSNACDGVLSHGAS
jgi:hypothetical protein